jgi:hypothetical protein
MDDDIVQSKNSFINNTITVSLIPGYAYLLAYAYEYGYCSHFGIPISLITPSLSSILLIISLIFLFIVSNLKLFGFFAPLLRVLQNPKYSAYHPFIRMNFFYLVLIVILIIVYGFYWAVLIPFLIVWFVWGILYFFPVLFDRKKKKLAERFEDYNKQEDKLDLAPFVFNYINPKFVKYGFIAALIAGFSYLLGNGEAYKQEEFYVSKYDSTQVFIRYYGDILIFSHINYSNKTISNTYRIISSSDLSILDLKKIRIGHLEKDVVFSFNKVESPKVDSTISKGKADTLKQNEQKPNQQINRTP